MSLLIHKMVFKSYEENTRQIDNNKFLVIFAAIPFKLEQVGPIFSSFNPCPSLPFVATDDREQFQFFIFC